MVELTRKLQNKRKKRRKEERRKEKKKKEAFLPSSLLKNEKLK